MILHIKYVYNGIVSDWCLVSDDCGYSSRTEYTFKLEYLLFHHSFLKKNKTKLFFFHTFETLSTLIYFRLYTNTYKLKLR